MCDPTNRSVFANKPTDAGHIADAGGHWTFEYDEKQTPVVSSKRKWVYKGTFARVGEEPLAARALVFLIDELVAFGRECANLRLLTFLGVGPRLLAIGKFGQVGSALELPVIIEQDAGECLATLLDDVCQNSESGDDVRLAPVGSVERELQNAKILYDVCTQIHSAHKAGIYHRDLRCENVCVRRIGPAPQDIRATVIDFDLGATAWEGKPQAKASLYDTLFRDVPLALGYSTTSFVPNPLELDMAYLAALQYHVEQGGLYLNGGNHASQEVLSFVTFVRERVGYFGFGQSGFPPYARELDVRLDMDDLAKTLGLVKVDKRSFASPRLLAHAKTYHRPYLDREDMRMCNNSPEAMLAAMVDKIAHAEFETYKRQRQDQGKPIEYENMEDQPLDLQRSNYAQAEHIPVKVRALGYELVPVGECDPERIVDKLTDEQIEVLAHLEHDRYVEERLAAGWALNRSATQSDSVSKTSPFLVSYDELDYDMQEYDRDAARQLIPLLRMAGLVMVRRA